MRKNANLAAFTDSCLEDNLLSSITGGKVSRKIKITTKAIGEEDCRGGASTQAIGEEDGGGGPTTQAIGEEDGGGGLTSLAIGEEK